MTSPAVSVIMSVRNGEKHLGAAVEGVLNQGFTDFEFIIVDDGSTDGTRNILDSFRDDRIILIRQENVGLTKSLNSAIRQAKGRYIARQDADDISLPGRLATQIDYLSTHPETALVGSAVEVIAANGERLATFRHPTEPDEIRKALRSYNCFWHGSVMMKRDSFLALGGYDERFVTAQDYDMWLRFSERYTLANLHDPLYAYRFSTDSVTVKKMVSQHRMGNLARQLAAQRGGTTTSQGEADFAASLSSPLTVAERKQIIENYKPWCRLLLKNSLFDEAARLMTELFRYHPNPFFRLAFVCGRGLNPQSNLARFIEYA